MHIRQQVDGHHIVQGYIQSLNILKEAIDLWSIAFFMFNENIIKLWDVIAKKKQSI